MPYHPDYPESAEDADQLAAEQEERDWREEEYNNALGELIEDYN